MIIKLLSRKPYANTDKKSKNCTSGGDYRYGDCSNVLAVAFDARGSRCTKYSPGRRFSEGLKERRGQALRLPKMTRSELLINVVLRCVCTQEGGTAFRKTWEVLRE